MRDEPTALYRLFNEDGQLLYVGISRQPWTRFSQHRGDKPWWPEVAWHATEWRATRNVALRDETLTIFRENPFYNRDRPSSDDQRLWEYAVQLEPRLGEFRTRFCAYAHEDAALEFLRPLVGLDRRRTDRSLGLVSAKDALLGLVDHLDAGFADRDADEDFLSLPSTYELCRSVLIGRASGGRFDGLCGCGCEDERFLVGSEVAW